VIIIFIAIEGRVVHRAESRGGGGEDGADCRVSEPGDAVSILVREEDKGR